MRREERGYDRTKLIFIPSRETDERKENPFSIYWIHKTLRTPFFLPVGFGSHSLVSPNLPVRSVMKMMKAEGYGEAADWRGKDALERITNENPFSF